MTLKFINRSLKTEISKSENYFISVIMNPTSHCCSAYRALCEQDDVDNYKFLDI